MPFESPWYFLYYLEILTPYHGLQVLPTSLTSPSTVPPQPYLWPPSCFIRAFTCCLCFSTCLSDLHMTGLFSLFKFYLKYLLLDRPLLDCPPLFITFHHITVCYFLHSTYCFVCCLLACPRTYAPQAMGRGPCVICSYFCFHFSISSFSVGFPGGTSDKEPTCQCRRL